MKINSRISKLFAIPVLGLAFAAAPAQASTETDNAVHAIATQLTNGGHILSNSWGADYGLTIDAVLLLTATKQADSEASASTDKVLSEIRNYIGSSGEKYAGPIGKALFFSAARGKGSVAAGINLQTRLTGMMKPNGRFSDVSQYGDYSSTISQSWSILGLRKSGATRNAAPYNFLYLQQCPNGGFRSSMSGAQCADSSKADVDATAFAIQALTTTSGSRKAAAVARARDYLGSQMAADGGVKAQASEGNANSTGLVTLALKNWPANAAAGESFIKNLQFGCAAPAALRGLIAYTATDKASEIAAATPAVTDKDLRATVQGALGLVRINLINFTSTGASTSVPAASC